MKKDFKLEVFIDLNNRNTGLYLPPAMRPSLARHSWVTSGRLDVEIETDSHKEATELASELAGHLIQLCQRLSVSRIKVDLSGQLGEPENPPLPRNIGKIEIVDEGEERMADLHVEEDGTLTI